jgi:hypothetical protein
MSGEVAARIGRRLIEIEYRGHGDLEAAMRRLEAKTGLSYWNWKAWWNAQSRPVPQGVLSETWERLVTFYRFECARQKRRFEEELAEAQALGRDETNSNLVRQAVALVREED